MQTIQRELAITTRGRGTMNITAQVDEAVRTSGIRTGLCHVFVQHTSASLMLCENADPTVRRDVEAFLARLVPDGDPLFRHTAEGPDDMPSHIRAILTKMDLSLPISAGRLALGTWQGVFLYEHRTDGQRRRVVVTIQGKT
ncbi:secondary thiamine-phosphate synthase enzyme YjbQ [Thiohalocapsa sp. ML1]|jgi:secondary thiamine-phosphate synthase enzyme|uniref:secondary thiamine-phosphate synthase enzyme YjbQ n=1 Tax=Thiohalocapsa sp. ML1 TaxID=1431688 RepID=UPI0007322CFF|nr:secondary thiamine-phosphate synthase enzyme YjbQ [Thiohalocapsa sp. ML1]